MRFEIIADVDAQLLLGQISDMSETGLDRILLAQKFLYGFSLGRGLDNY